MGPLSAAQEPGPSDSAEQLIASIVERQVADRLKQRNYVILLASGPEDGGKRATLAFSAACSARAMELNTHVFLIADGSHWAYQGSGTKIHYQGFPALDDLIESLIGIGGKIYVCSACDTVCVRPGERDARPLLKRRGVETSRLATVLAYTVEGSSVTF